MCVLACNAKVYGLLKVTIEHPIFSTLFRRNLMNRFLYLK